MITDSTANADCFCESGIADFRYIARIVIDTGGNTAPARNADANTNGNAAWLTTENTSTHSAIACKIASGIITDFGPF